MLKRVRSSLSPQPLGTPPTNSLFSEFVVPRSAELTAESAKRTCYKSSRNRRVRLSSRRGWAMAARFCGVRDT